MGAMGNLGQSRQSTDDQRPGHRHTCSSYGRDLEGNLGSILYEAGRKWNQVKATTPDKLEAPMRIILMQKLLLTVLERYNAMMASEEKIAKAKQMGWLSDSGQSMNAMRWNPEKKCHDVNKEIPPKDCVSVKEGLSAMAVLCSSPRVVNRFHATRQMAEAYESPTMMDVGLRTVEAGKMRHLLNDLAHSAVWLMAGAYMRHSRMHRGPLAQRIAQAQESGVQQRTGQGQRQGQQAGPDDSSWERRIMNMIFRNQGKHCYTNALTKSLMMLWAQQDAEVACFLQAKLLGLFRGFLMAPRPITIWANPFWRASFHRWSSPNTQH